MKLVNNTIKLIIPRNLNFAISTEFILDGSDLNALYKNKPHCITINTIDIIVKDLNDCGKSIFVSLSKYELINKTDKTRVTNNNKYGEKSENKPITVDLKSKFCNDELDTSTNDIIINNIIAQIIEI